MWSQRCWRAMGSSRISAASWLMVARSSLVRASVWSNGVPMGVDP